MSKEADHADHIDVTCPHCNAHRSEIQNSIANRGIRYRTHKCLGCKRNFTTAEQVIDISMYKALVYNAPFTVLQPKEPSSHGSA